MLLTLGAVAAGGAAYLFVRPAPSRKARHTQILSQFSQTEEGRHTVRQGEQKTTEAIQRAEQGGRTLLERAEEELAREEALGKRVLGDAKVKMDQAREYAQEGRREGGRWVGDKIEQVERKTEKAVNGARGTVESARKAGEETVNEVKDEVRDDILETRSA